MSTIGQPERVTQNRIIALFRDELRYRNLGDWTDRPDNWRDNNGPKEKLIKNELYKILQDVAEVERLFPIIKAQKEY